MQIGSYKFDTPIILAPMAGVTDKPFRQLCKNLGADLAVSEMVAANSLLYGSNKTKLRANFQGETKPWYVQIVGACPKMLAESARLHQDNGAQIIDINMGCPAKKICNTLAGSALLKDELLVEKIINSVVKAVTIPVTLKIRTGWDQKSRNCEKIAKIAQDCGIQAITVHGRTRACKFKGVAEYNFIKKVKSSVSIPVIANGDITTPEKALEVLQFTNADALMIGRAALGKPWIFKEIKHFLKSDKLFPTPSYVDIRNLMLQHLKNIYEFYGEYKGVLIARKHVGWFSKGYYKSAQFRFHFNQLTKAQHQLEHSTQFFENLIQG